MKRRRYADAREGLRRALADLDRAERKMLSAAREIGDARSRVAVYLARLGMKASKRELLARCAEILEQVKTGARRQLLDACGQAPCPVCEAVMTNEGRVCVACEARGE